MKRVRAILFVLLIAVAGAATAFTIPISEIRNVYAGYGGGLRGLLLTAMDRTTITDILNDNVFLHDRWIDLFGGAQRLTGVNVVIDQTVAVHRMSGDRVTVILTDCEPFTDEEEEGLRTLAQAAEDVSAQKLFVSIPRKTCGLHEEFLSRGVQTYSEDVDAYRMRAFAQAGFDVLDLHDAMHREGKDHASLYFRTDHHWTAHAGFWAAKEIGDALGIDTALLDPSLFSVEAHPGMFLGSEGKRGGRLYCAPDDLDILIPTFDTALTLQINEDAPRSGSFRETMLFPERLTPKLYKEHFPYAVFLNGDHACVRMQNTILQDGPKVLLIKDSFANCTAPYLALCCAQVDLIDVRRYSESVAAYIARTRPDAVCVTMDSAIENKHFAFQ